METNPSGRSRRFRRRGFAPLRRRSETGQALVEFVVILPLMVLLLGGGFTAWEGMQRSIRLTTAARAGAIVAANDLQSGTGNAWSDATLAVNQEEGVTNVYQNTSSSAADYVNMAQSTDTLDGTGLTIHVVTITITHTVIPLVSGVWKVPVSASATARYS